ncbi:MAG: hypothetical protein ACUVXF_02615 [Desulfobaccales bacterium]
MEPNDAFSDFAPPARTDKPADLQKLWDQWDQAQKEETASEYTRGLNLLGVGLFIVGSVCYALGAGWLKAGLAPLVLVIGASILAVKKIKSLWRQRTLER